MLWWIKTPIQNYFEKVLYENLTFEIPPLWFSSYQSPVNRLHVNKESNHVITLQQVKDNVALGHMQPLTVS
jgi:hypothetical protein